MSNYEKFKQRYESLTTEELLRIAITTELIPEAQAALKSELNSRLTELDREKYQSYIESVTPPSKESFHFLINIGIIFGAGFLAFFAWGWDIISAWLK